MPISWTGNLKVKNKDGTEKIITTAPRTGMNADLIIVGATYGVTKFLYAGDDPHWSTTGH